MNPSKLLKGIVGTMFFVPGWAMVMWEVWRAIQQSLDTKAGIDISWTILGIGFLFLLIGGYVAAPVLTDHIADEIAEKLTLWDRIKGGRRKTDPPLDETEEVKVEVKAPIEDVSIKSAEDEGAVG